MKNKKWYTDESFQATVITVYIALLFVALIIALTHIPL